MIFWAKIWPCGRRLNISNVQIYAEQPILTCPLQPLRAHHERQVMCVSSSLPLLSEKNAVIIGLRVSNFSEFDAVDKMRTWKLFKNGLISGVGKFRFLLEKSLDNFRFFGHSTWHRPLENSRVRLRDEKVNKRRGCSREFQPSYVMICYGELQTAS